MARLGFNTPFSVYEGSIINLNLFEDTLFVSNIQKTNEYVQGVTTIHGDIEGSSLGFMILSYDDGKALGTIEISENNQRFVVRYDANTNMHYVLEVDVSNHEVPPSYIEEEPEINNNSDEIDVFNNEPVPEQNHLGYVDDFTSNGIGIQDFNNDLYTNEPMADVGVTKIRVMVVYTPHAFLHAFIQGGIGNVIGNNIGFANSVLDNSKTYLELDPVYVGMVEYEESGSPGADLRRLTCKPGELWTGHGGDPYDECPYNPGEEYDIGSLDPEGGHMDEVHAIRDETAADLVAFFPYNEEPHIGGSAWPLNTINGRPHRGFSQTDIQFSYGDEPYVFIHEIGHNLGAGHHKEQKPGSFPGPQLFDYSAGWRDPALEICTVMTYTGGSHFDDGITTSRIPYFSNPYITHPEYGVKIGDQEDADNARTIREAKHVVASYRNILEIGVNFDHGGTTYPPPGSYFYAMSDSGELPTESLTAIPNPGWEFSHWYGDVPWNQRENNPIDIHMDRDRSINAHFKHPFELYDWSIIGETQVYPEQEVTIEGYVYNSGDVTYSDYIDLEI